LTSQEKSRNVRRAVLAKESLVRSSSTKGFKIDGNLEEKEGVEQVNGRRAVEPVYKTP